MGKDTGIDSMAVYIPKYYVDAGELAEKRGVSPEKFRQGLGIERFSVFYRENLVDAGVNAVSRLLERSESEKISRFYVATETALDEAKPLGCFILGRLKGYDFQNVESLELKFACVAGSYAVYDCWNYLKLHPDRKAIVLCLDEARYDLRSAAEPTQGGGAVALLLGAEPGLVSLDFSSVGVFTGDINDFYRPFGRETPIVDGDLSVYTYLLAVKEAYRDLKQKLGKDLILDQLDRLVFHVPYPKMIMHGLSFLLRHEYRNTESWKEIRKETAEPEPEVAGSATLFDENFRERDRRFRKALMKTQWFEEVFQEKTSASLIATSQTGNLYAGSIWLALASLFEYGEPEAGEKVGFGSYGSGAGTLAFQGTVKAGEKMVLEEQFSKRQKLSVEEYEKMRLNNK